MKFSHVVATLMYLYLIAPQDPNSIVMTIDMHLTLPPGFIEYIRRVSLQPVLT